MLKRLTALFVLAILWVPAGWCAGQTIVVVGDSLSSGYGLAAEQSWVTMLQNHLHTEGYGYEVVNASIAGDTSSGGLARLPRLLDQHDPAIVVIELGGNDGLRGQPVASLRANLIKMVELSLASGARVLLAGMQIPPNFGGSYTQALSAVYPEVAAQFMIPIVPFLLEGVALKPELMQQDRLHPNAAGQEILFDNVWPILSKLLTVTDAR